MTLTPQMQNAAQLKGEGLSDAEVATRLGIRPTLLYTWRLCNGEFQRAVRERRGHPGTEEVVAPPAETSAAEPSAAEGSPASGEAPAGQHMPVAEQPVVQKAVVPTDAAAPMVTTRMASFS